MLSKSNSWIICLILSGLLWTLSIPSAFSQNESFVSASNEWREQSKILVGIVQEDIFPLDDWWEQFEDPILSGYIKEAVSYNYSIKEAQARIEQAQAASGQVKSLLFPWISIGGGYQQVRNFAPSNGDIYEHSVYTMPLQANYELDLFGKNRLKHKSSKKLIDQKQQEKEVTQIAISSQVASTYFNLLLADDLVRNTQELISNLEQSIKLRRQLYDGGITSYDDIFLSEQELSHAKDSLSEYEKERSVFSHQLCILRGLNPQEYQAIKRNSFFDINIPQNIYIGLPDRIITHRPDIICAEITLQKSLIDIKEARREFFPTINIGAQFGFGAMDGNPLWGWQNRVFGLGGSLAQSLFTGGYKKSNLKLQKAIYEERVNNYHTVVLTAFKEVEDSLSSFRNDYLAYEKNLDTISKSQHYVNVANIRYKNGVGSKIDALSAQRQALNEQIIADKNKEKSIIDIISLYKALGGGYLKWAG